MLQNGYALLGWYKDNKLQVTYTKENRCCEIQTEVKTIASVIHPGF